MRREGFAVSPMNKDEVMPHGLRRDLLARLSPAVLAMAIPCGELWAGPPVAGRRPGYSQPVPAAQMIVAGQGMMLPAEEYPQVPLPTQSLRTTRRPVEVSDLSQPTIGDAAGLDAGSDDLVTPVTWQMYDPRPWSMQARRAPINPPLMPPLRDEFSGADRPPSR